MKRRLTFHELTFIMFTGSRWMQKRRYFCRMALLLHDFFHPFLKSWIKVYLIISAKGGLKNNS